MNVKRTIMVHPAQLVLVALRVPVAIMAHVTMAEPEQENVPALMAIKASPAMLQENVLELVH